MHKFTLLIQIYSVRKFTKTQYLIVLYIIISFSTFYEQKLNVEGKQMELMPLCIQLLLLLLRLSYVYTGDFVFCDFHFALQHNNKCNIWLLATHAGMEVLVMAKI